MKKTIHAIENAYRLPVNKVLEALDTSIKGLSHQESTKRLATIGPNNLEQLKKDSIFIKWLRQFKDLMIILLVVAALIAFYLNDQRTGAILLTIVLVNSLIGLTQEYKAEKIMESLKALEVSEAKVYREGKLETIAACNLVSGDIILIEEGEAIPADGRIIEEAELATNDFALTGESNPSRKFTHFIDGMVGIGDRRNLVFMGTTVAIGNAKVVVIATGMATELGRIANLSQQTKPGLSPLQREMNNLAFRITIGTLILAAALVAISLGAHLSIKDALIFAIGIASAMIPQGLPAEVNVSLVQAASKLANQRALVKMLSAVETLGATSVICTDKTGTLTKNEMTVERISLLNKSYAVSGSGYQANGLLHHENGLALEPTELKNLHHFLITGVFASNAIINPPDQSHNSWYCLGDPTEGALITLATKAGLDVAVLGESYPELKEFPFDSARKRMSSVRNYDNQLTVFVKGAPEAILAKCNHILVDNKVRALTESDKKIILEKNEQLATKAMRNLAYAYKPLSVNVDYHIHDPEVVENELIYMGMVSIIDPVREEVAEAMQAARDAHIKVSIITGDYAPTAKAIAVRAKLADKPEDLVVVTAEELATMDDKRILDLVLAGGVIFSRVSPEDKLHIVDLVRAANKVVAVTGDGINDAPALKRADIGVAMGKIGTDVAKQSAEIVLLDDSFHTLVTAIQQGRVIYQNIKKSIMSCLSSNFGELTVVLVSLLMASLFGYPAAILAVQILAIDLIAEILPIAALGWDKPERSLMHDSPRNLQEHIFNRRNVGDLITTGLLMGGLGYLNFILFAGRHNLSPQNLTQSAEIYATATTITYITIVLCQLANILLRRSQGATLSKYLFTNRQLWFAIAFSLLFVINIAHNPFLQNIFGTNDLTSGDWLYAIGAAMAFFAIRETLKLLKLFGRKKW